MQLNNKYEPQINTTVGNVK